MIKTIRVATVVVAFTAASVGWAASASAHPTSQRPKAQAVAATDPNASHGPATAGDVGTQAVYGPYPTYPICLAVGAAGVAAGRWVSFVCVGSPGAYYLVTYP